MLKISCDAMRTTLTCHLGFLSLLVHWDSTWSSWRWFVFECFLHWIASVSIRSFDASSKCFLSDPFLYFSFQGCSQIYIEMVLENFFEIHSLTLCNASPASFDWRRCRHTRWLTNISGSSQVDEHTISLKQMHSSIFITFSGLTCVNIKSGSLKGIFRFGFVMKCSLENGTHDYGWTLYIYVMARWIYI